nr:hypothetical protein [Tanacetum cinerariifolium]
KAVTVPGLQEVMEPCIG